MKGIDMIASERTSSPANLVGLASVANSRTSQFGVAELRGHEEHLDAQSGSQAMQPPQSIFMTQSIDEIAQLYIESPFSW